MADSDSIDTWFSSHNLESLSGGTHLQWRRWQSEPADASKRGNSFLLRDIHNNLHQVTPDLVNRLGLESELEGHEGCVNSINWNYSGTLIATGSDDRTVIIWNPHRKLKVAHLRTQHTNNIFCVKFMPDSNDNLIAVAAGDNRVSVVDVSRNDTLMLCSCHLGRVKKLAVTGDSPFLILSGAEDGTVRQIDLRESHRCSERTSDILVNHLFHCDNMAEIKTIALNPTRSELLAVGGNDPYTRLYDRRFIKPYSFKVEDMNKRGIPLVDRNSAENKCLLSDGCATYFVPGHIPCERDKRRSRSRSLASTHVTFDPSGQKLLVNLGGEQIYLFDVFEKEPPAFLSVDKLTQCVHPPTNVKSQNLPEEIQMLKAQANAAFDKSQFNLAVDLYNEALRHFPRSALLLSNRSAALMKRKWVGDVYAALRDSLRAIELDLSHMKAHYRVARCLIDLDRPIEAEQAVHVFEDKFPGEVKATWFVALKKDLQKLKDLKAKLQSNGHTSGSTSSDDDPVSIEMVLTPRPSVFSARKKNYSELEVSCRMKASDYEQRLCGHCNTATDIKEAEFFGDDGQYIVAGSDDGSFFVWDRETTNIVRILKGDESCVNCLQPHPTTCLLATSGIESVVRLWAPMPEGFQNDRLVADASNAALANQRRMETDPMETVLNAMSAQYNIHRGQGEEESEGGYVPPNCRTT